jgi:hypothetical protein
MFVAGDTELVGLLSADETDSQERRWHTNGTSGTSEDVRSRPKTWLRRPCVGWCH